MSSDELDERIESLLRAADQRYTAGRRRLIAALQQGDGPLTINQIAEIDDSLANSSVYRNLTLLEEAGAVTRIVTNDDFARYELAEQLTSHHHHLICNECGDILDFELDARVERTLDKALDQAAAASGFVATSHRLDLLGTCANCS